MTDIIAAEIPRGRKAGFGRAKRHSLRIDMTPMVDLGFLLITFFIYTSTMTEPTVMRLAMPTDKGTPMPTKQSGALTLLPSVKQTVFYYEGEYKKENLRMATIKEIRNVIMDKKRRTPADDLFVIIKASRWADYRNVVDVLDEMVISDVKRYALVKITEEEELVIK